MIGYTLEARHKGKDVLVLQIHPELGRAVCITTESRLVLIPTDEIDMLWHHDEQEGWVADSQSFKP